MIGYLRELRLIPIALIASACLLALKTADLVLDSNYFFGRDNAPAQEADASIVRAMPDLPQPPQSKLSWAQQMFNFGDNSGSARSPTRLAAAPPIADRSNLDITGSVTPEADKAGAKTEAKEGDPKPAPVAALGKDGKPAGPPAGTLIAVDGAPLPTGAERAILERLQERRQELDTRARELDIRESLIKGAEKRMDARLAEIKEVEGKIVVDTQKKDEAEVARFKGLVTMYENMKPRDAAKIFDRLDSDVLLEVASQINPRKMSDILALMAPDSAEHLTVELASQSKSGQPKQGGTADLPKIDGRPTTP